MGKKQQPKKPVERGTFGITNPVQRPHSSPKGERGFCRKNNKRALRMALRDHYEKG